MWDPYITSIKEHCPIVELVFDKFHVIKKLIEALDNIRKREFAQANARERLNIKRKRYIILKRQKNLKKRYNNWPWR